MAIYKIVDICRDIIVAEGLTSNLAVLDIWASRISRNGKLDFSKLNVTGKDTHVVSEPCGTYWAASAKMWVNQYVTRKELKPFQVVDEFGRSQDIKGWTEDISEFNRRRGALGSKYAFFRTVLIDPDFNPFDGVCTGGKRNNQKGKEVSMLKQNRKDITDPVDEELEGLPMRHPNRQRIDFPASGLYDDRHERHIERSWKYQSRTAKQWGKHKRSKVKKSALRQQDKRNFPIEEVDTFADTMWEISFIDQEAKRLTYSDRIRDEEFGYLVDDIPEAS